jgi:hypothetical protein
MRLPNALLTRGANGRRRSHIRAYWFARGYEIEAWIERGLGPKGKRPGRTFAVRTNLVGGLPPRGRNT